MADDTASPPSKPLTRGKSKLKPLPANPKSVTSPQSVNSTPLFVAPSTGTPVPNVASAPTNLRSAALDFSVGSPDTDQSIPILDVGGNASNQTPVPPRSNRNPYITESPRLDAPDPVMLASQLVSGGGGGGGGASNIFVSGDTGVSIQQPFPNSGQQAFPQPVDGAGGASSRNDNTAPVPAIGHNVVVGMGSEAFKMFMTRWKKQRLFELQNDFWSCLTTCCLYERTKPYKATSNKPDSTWEAACKSHYINCKKGQNCSLDRLFKTVDNLVSGAGGAGGLEASHHHDPSLPPHSNAMAPRNVDELECYAECCVNLETCRVEFIYKKVNDDTDFQEQVTSYIDFRQQDDPQAEHFHELFDVDMSMTVSRFEAANGIYRLLDRNRALSGALSSPRAHSESTPGTAMGANRFASQQTIANDCRHTWNGEPLDGNHGVCLSCSIFCANAFLTGVGSGWPRRYSGDGYEDVRYLNFLQEYLPFCVKARRCLSKPATEAEGPGYEAQDSVAAGSSWVWQLRERGVEIGVRVSRPQAVLSSLKQGSNGALWRGIDKPCSGHRPNISDSTWKRGALNSFIDKFYKETRQIVAIPTGMDLAYPKGPLRRKLANKRVKIDGKISVAIGRQGVVQVATGWRDESGDPEGHVALLTNLGQVYSFGCAGSGQLGRGPRADEDLRRVDMPAFVVQVACGDRHTMALCSNGWLFSWGSNTFGQLGLGKAPRKVWDPTRVSSLGNIGSTAARAVSISCGGNHSAAVLDNGMLYTWGQNKSGQLGIQAVNGQPRLGSYSHPQCVKYVPMVRSEVKKNQPPTAGQWMHAGYTTKEVLPWFVTVSCGAQHTMAIDRDGVLYGCGSNKWGQVYPWWNPKLNAKDTAKVPPGGGPKKYHEPMLRRLCIVAETGPDDVELHSFTVDPTGDESKGLVSRVECGVGHTTVFFQPPLDAAATRATTDPNAPIAPRTQAVIDWGQRYQASGAGTTMDRTSQPSTPDLRKQQSSPSTIRGISPEQNLPVKEVIHVMQTCDYKLVPIVWTDDTRPAIDLCCVGKRTLVLLWEQAKAPRMENHIRSQQLRFVDSNTGQRQEDGGCDTTCEHSHHDSVPRGYCAVGCSPFQMVGYWPRKSARNLDPIAVVANHRDTQMDHQLDDKRLQKIIAAFSATHSNTHLDLDEAFNWIVAIKAVPILMPWFTRSRHDVERTTRHGIQQWLVNNVAKRIETGNGNAQWIVAFNDLKKLFANNSPADSGSVSMASNTVAGPTRVVDFALDIFEQSVSLGIEETIHSDLTPTMAYNQRQDSMLQSDGLGQRALLDGAGMSNAKVSELDEAKAMGSKLGVLIMDIARAHVCLHSRQRNIAEAARLTLRGLECRLYGARSDEIFVWLMRVTSAADKRSSQILNEEGAGHAQAVVATVLDLLEKAGMRRPENIQDFGVSLGGDGDGTRKNRNGDNATGGSMQDTADETTRQDRIDPHSTASNVIIAAVQIVSFRIVSTRGQLSSRFLSTLLKRQRVPTLWRPWMLFPGECLDFWGNRGGDAGLTTGNQDQSKMRHREGHVVWGFGCAKCLSSGKRHGMHCVRDWCTFGEWLEDSNGVMFRHTELLQSMMQELYPDADAVLHYLLRFRGPRNCAVLGQEWPFLDGDMERLVEWTEKIGDLSRSKDAQEDAELARMTTIVARNVLVRVGLLSHVAAAWMRTLEWHDSSPSVQQAHHSEPGNFYKVLLRLRAVSDNNSAGVTAAMIEHLRCAFDGDATDLDGFQTESCGAHELRAPRWSMSMLERHRLEDLMPPVFANKLLAMSEEEVSIPKRNAFLWNLVFLMSTIELPHKVWIEWLASRDEEGGNMERLARSTTRLRPQALERVMTLGQLDLQENTTESACCNHTVDTTATAVVMPLLVLNVALAVGLRHLIESSSDRETLSREEGKLLLARNESTAVQEHHAVMHTPDTEGDRPVSQASVRTRDGSLIQFHEHDNGHDHHDHHDHKLPSADKPLSQLSITLPELMLVFVSYIVGYKFIKVALGIVKIVLAIPIMLGALFAGVCNSLFSVAWSLVSSRFGSWGAGLYYLRNGQWDAWVAMVKVRSPSLASRLQNWDRSNQVQDEATLLKQREQSRSTQSPNATSPGDRTTTGTAVSAAPSGKTGDNGWIVNRGSSQQTPRTSGSGNPTVVDRDAGTGRSSLQNKLSKNTDHNDADNSQTSQSKRARRSHLDAGLQSFVGSYKWVERQLGKKEQLNSLWRLNVKAVWHSFREQAAEAVSSVGRHMRTRQDSFGYRNKRKQSAMLRSDFEDDHRREALAVVAILSRDFDFLQTHRSKFAWRTSLRAFASYAVHLTILTVFAWSVLARVGTNFDHSVYQQNLVIKDAVIDGDDGHNSISDIGSWWDWVDAKLLPTVTADGGMYNGTELPHGDLWWGAVRLRQMRSRTTSCALPGSSSNVGQHDYLYDHGDEEENDRLCFQPSDAGFSDANFGDGGEGFTYIDEDGLGYARIDGVGFLSGHTYYGDGYAVDIPTTDITSAKEIVDRLRGDDRHTGWLDAATRVVFVEVSAYSSSMDMTTFLTLTTEIKVVGTLHNTENIDTFPSPKITVEFVLFLLATLLFTGKECRQVLEIGDGYFADFWNWYEMLLASVWLSSIGLFIYLYSSSPTPSELVHPTAFYNPYVIRTSFIVLRNILAWSLLISWLRTTKYLARVPRAGPIVNATLNIFWSVKMLIFLLFYFFVLVSFAFAMLVLAGDRLETYSTIGSSLMAQFRGALVGDMDFAELAIGNMQASGTLFYTAVVLVSAIIFTNILIAVVSSEWESGLEDGERIYWDSVASDMASSLTSSLTSATLSRLTVARRKAEEVREQAQQPQRRPEGRELHALQEANA